jgi:NADH-quinone oxidoreductase subunit I
VIGMLKGMATTFRFWSHPAETVQYPKVKRELPERSRTMFTLPLGPDGKPACKACGVCAKNCPDAAITLESMKNPDAPGRLLLHYSIDLGKCMYCGLCVENCPSEGVEFTGDYERATSDRDSTQVVLYDVPEAERPAAPDEGAAS